MNEKEKFEEQMPYHSDEKESDIRMLYYPFIWNNTTSIKNDPVPLYALINSRHRGYYPYIGIPKHFVR